MSGVFATFWKKLLHDLGLRRERARGYYHEQELVQSLQDLAERESRSEQDIAYDLLTYALEQRQADESNLRIWSTLTQREQQVAALAGLNFTNRQIARRLDISPETVKTHMRSILAKFDLRSKAELRQALDGWDFSAWLNL